MKKVLFYLLFIFAVLMSSGTFTSCKHKKTGKELIAEHEANRLSIKKKLTKQYAYDVTKIVLSEKFSKIDTIIITKYDCHPDNIGKWEDANYRAYVRTDGKVKGKIYDQEGTFTYWFETHIDKNDIEAKIFKVESLFAKDKDGDQIIAKYGIHDLSAEEYKKNKQESIERRAYAKQYEVTVDGIKVSFLSKDEEPEGAYLNYYSEKKLSDNQIRKVGKKIKMKYFMVMFSPKDDSDYAYYLLDDDIIKHKNPNNRHLYY